MERTYVTICLVVVCVAAAPLAALAHETPPPYPRLEPNDDFDEATTIQPRTLHGLAAIKYTNATGRPAIQSPPYWKVWGDDRDTYAVELERGDALPVTMYHYGEDGNLRYTVYDPSRSEVATVDPDGSWQQTGSALGRTDRSIQRGETTVTARCNGTYYVRVRSDDRTRAPYRLEVDDRFEHNDNRSTAPTLTAGTYDDLMLTTYDRDYYRIDVQKGETIEATIDLQTLAHWEVGPAVRPVRVEDPVTSDEWAPYDHTRWEEPSFHFRPTIGGPGQSGDYSVNPVNQVKYDELHRDKSSIEITETGTVYFVVRSNTWWTSAIDGAAKWNANGARYDLTITRTGTPESDSPPAETDGGDDSVRNAFENLDVESSSTDVGVGRSQLAGEVVNLRVEGSGTYSFEITESLDVEEFRGCGREDATVRLETDTDTVREIEESDDSVGSVESAYREGDVRVEGIGTVNSVKWEVINHVRRVSEWLRPLR